MVQRNQFVSTVFVASCLFTAILPGQALRTPEFRSGTFRGQPVVFEDVDGVAIVDGDIVLAPVAEIQHQSVATRPQHPVDSAVFLRVTSSLWPRVDSIAEIPYVDNLGSREISQAVEQFNKTFGDAVRWVKRSRQADYVSFDSKPNSDTSCTGTSSIGRVGGAQSISLVGFGCLGVILHEMGHAVGLLHEHNRFDREKYVRLNWANIPSDNVIRDQYRQAFAGGQDAALFDFSSVMIYDYFSPRIDQHVSNLETIPPGIRLRATAAYSAGDIDTIRRLFGPPNQPGVTVSTNPPGLQTLVDGQLQVVTRSFSWALNSTHRLDVPAQIQGLATAPRRIDYFQFARWNDVVDFNAARPPAAGHFITVSPGDGSAMYPGNLPLVASYVANFVKLNPGWLAVTARPGNGGRVTIAEAPIMIEQVPYHKADSPVTVFAEPAAGYSFYCWQDGNLSSVSFTKPGCLAVNGSGNPRKVKLEITTALTALFTRSPVTVIATNPPGLPFRVDFGKPYVGDYGFSADRDRGWANDGHWLSVEAQQPAQRVDFGAVLRFKSWTVGDTASYSASTDIRVEIGNNPPKKIVANYVSAFPLILSQNANYSRNADYACGANFEPAGQPQLYDEGSTVEVKVLPRKGWFFVGWEDPALPAANPARVRMDGTRQLRAILNTTDAALAVTGLSPPVASMGGRDFTLAVNGSGFTPRTSYCLYNERGINAVRCGAATFVSPNQVLIPIGGNILSVAQRLELELVNDDGQSCEVRLARQFLPVQ